MATDFTNNNTTISTSGGLQPTTRNTPLDIRTRVNLKADIETIPNPFIGMHIIVLQDESNNNKMTEYIVKSLKANALGIANSVINEVELFKDFLGAVTDGTVDFSGYAKLEDVGDKVNLTTTANDNLVNAINELNINCIRIGEDINDSILDVDSNVLNRLSALESLNAEENVQSDWNETNVTSDAYIKNKPNLTLYVEKTYVDAELIKKVNISDVIDNLTSTDTNKPLSANQGKVLKDEVGNLVDLTTTEKGTIVGAINELKTSNDIGGSSYTLPTASASTLGGIKVGNGLSIDGSGVLSVKLITTAQIDAICGEILN